MAHCQLPNEAYQTPDNWPPTLIDLLSGICYATGKQNERNFVSWKDHYRLLNPMG